MAFFPVTWLQLCPFIQRELPEAFDNLPDQDDYEFIDQADPEADNYTPENHMIVGRICLDDQDALHYRHLQAYVHPETLAVTLGFKYQGHLWRLRTWDDITFELKFCAPFNLIDMTDERREERFNLFVEYGFLMNGMVDHLMIEEDFLRDLAEILLDVAWGWTMWSSIMDRPAAFAMETGAIERDNRVYHGHEWDVFIEL